MADSNKFNLIVDGGEGYNSVLVTTYDKTIHEFIPEDCPDFVQDYLKIFYQQGWSIEYDELWERTFDYFADNVNRETIESIVGEAEWGEDIIYAGQ